MLRKLLIVGCLLCSVPVFAQKTDKNSDAQTDYKAIGAPLPNLRVAVPPPPNSPKGTPDKIITNDDVDNKANLILMLFNPTCSHCEEQTQNIEKAIAMFDKSKLLMVATPAMRPYMDKFLKDYHIDQYPSIIAGVDSANMVDKLFLYKMLPQINIYDRHRKLIKTFTSGAPIDSLKHYVQ
jgi:hypothetical protein